MSTKFRLCQHDLGVKKFRYHQRREYLCHSGLPRKLGLNFPGLIGPSPPKLSHSFNVFAALTGWFNSICEKCYGTLTFTSVGVGALEATTNSRQAGVMISLYCSRSTRVVEAIEYGITMLFISNALLVGFFLFALSVLVGNE